MNSDPSSIIREYRIFAFIRLSLVYVTYRISVLNENGLNGYWGEESVKLTLYKNVDSEFNEYEYNDFVMENALGSIVMFATGIICSLLVLICEFVLSQVGHIHAHTRLRIRR